MSTDPDVIRADIERTRTRLSNDVNSLTNEANPKTIVGRRVDRARSAVGSVKDKVMGSASDSPSSVGSATSSASDSPSSATDTLGEAASSVGDAVASAPQTVRAQTQGNPLAAGLIAFGAGALLGSLLPASAKEAEAAEKIKEAAQPVAQHLGEVAKETAESLKEPAQQAVESVKSTAADAATTVKDEGTSAAQGVKEQAQDSAQQVQDQRS